jgi:hypothetical protein
MPFIRVAKVVMNPLDLFWHLANFFLPALGLGLLAPVLAKLLWRRTLRQRAYWRLAAWSGTAAAAALLAGVLVLERDGRMGTYAAMTLASALALWWAAFGSAQHPKRLKR